MEWVPLKSRHCGVFRLDREREREGEPSMEWVPLKSRHCGVFRLDRERERERGRLLSA